MTTARLFSVDQNNYQASLLVAIASYVESNKDKVLRKSGIARARSLKAMVCVQLVEREQLNDLQLMWRMLSYIKMARGAGPLDSSTNLRFTILDYLCRFLNVSQGDINALVTQKRDVLIQAMLASANSGMTGFMLDEQKIKEEARIELATQKLASIRCSIDGNVSEALKNTLLLAINAYQVEAKDRWFKGEGIERAEELKEFINTQLVGREKLNDSQLATRMVEMLSLPVGFAQGMLGTSKDLRHTLAKSMCAYLNLDEEVMGAEITLRATPVVVPSSLGPSGYYPDFVVESTQVRLRYLAKAVHYNPEVKQSELADPAPRPISLSH